jgi:hypothetical protein
MAVVQDTYVYVICRRLDDSLSAPCKIGIARQPDKRLRLFQTACPFPITLFATIGPMPRWAGRYVETSLRNVQSKDRLHGEWFSLEPLAAMQMIQLSIATAFHVKAGADFHRALDVVDGHTSLAIELPNNGSVAAALRSNGLDTVVP